MSELFNDFDYDPYDDPYFEEDKYDYCYECEGRGDDYYTNKKGKLVCRCNRCSHNPDYDPWEDDY